MTSRERLVAAARGGPVDHAPWFAWAADTPAAVALRFAESTRPDAVVVESAIDAQSVLADSTETAVLVEVKSPYGEALEAGVNLNTEFDSDIGSGQALLDAYSAGVSNKLMAAIESGADGVLYRLYGASPEMGSPMQYGGRLMEADRELLQSVDAARFNVLYVEGREPYLDAIADLPCSALSWEESAGVAVQEAKRIAPAAIACGLLGNVREIWEELLGIGIIFSARVEELDPSQFAQTSSLMEELTTIYV